MEGTNDFIGVDDDDDDVSMRLRLLTPLLSLCSESWKQIKMIPQSSTVSLSGL